MNQKSVWIAVGLVCVVVLVIGLANSFAQREADPLRPQGPGPGFGVGRYQCVLTTTNHTVVILDTVTGDLYKAELKDIKPLSAKPKVEMIRPRPDDPRPDRRIDDRKVDEKPRDRPADDRKRDEKPKLDELRPKFDDRPKLDDRKRDEKPKLDDRKNEDQPKDEKPRDVKLTDEKPKDEKPRDDRKKDEKPREETK